MNGLCQIFVAWRLPTSLCERLANPLDSLPSSHRGDRSQNWGSGDLPSKGSAHSFDMTSDSVGCDVQCLGNSILHREIQPTCSSDLSFMFNMWALVSHYSLSNSRSLTHTCSVYLNQSWPLSGDVNVELHLLADGNHQHALRLHVEMLLASNSNLPWGENMQSLKRKSRRCSQTTFTFINLVDSFKGFSHISPLKQTSWFKVRWLLDGFLSQKVWRWKVYPSALLAFSPVNYQKTEQNTPM